MKKNNQKKSKAIQKHSVPIQTEHPGNPGSKDGFNLFQAVGHIVLILDSHRTIVSANRAAIDIIGKSEENLIGKKCFSIFQEPEGSCDSCPIDHKSPSKAFETTGFETMISNRWFLASCTPIPDKNENLSHTILTALDMTAQKKAAEQLKKNLKEKELLLQETHHRVKNNLQVISSLINLQTHNLNNAELNEISKETQNRIRSMAYVHDELYHSKDTQQINCHQYIDRLAGELYRTYSHENHQIQLNLNVQHIFLDINYAVPLGIIITELLSNALKYAFPENWQNHPQINVMMHQTTGNQLVLVVKDNGVGIPQNIDLKKGDTLGLQLVSMLVEDQFKGKVSVERKNGTQFKISFKI